MTSYILQSYSKKPDEYQMIKRTPNTNNARIGLQYGLTDDIMNSLDTNIDDYDKGDWCFAEHSPENLQKLIPDTPKGNSQSWKIIVVISKNVGDDVCLKSALRGEDGTIMLMSSISPECQKNYKYGTAKSKDGEWKICKAKMIAPMFFWREIQYRI